MSKRRHFRLRRILKWFSLFAFAGSLILWCVSLHWFIRYNSQFSYVLSPGEFLFIYRTDEPFWEYLPVSKGWTVKTQGAIGNVLLLSMPWRGYLIRENKPSGHTIIVPLWAAIALLAIPTAFLWHHDRPRLPPNHCRDCGYDLTGNVSGVCSECGTPIESAEKTA